MWETIYGCRPIALSRADKGMTIKAVRKPWPQNKNNWGTIAANTAQLILTLLTFSDRNIKTMIKCKGTSPPVHIHIHMRPLFEQGSNWPYSIKRPPRHAINRAITTPIRLIGITCRVAWPWEFVWEGELVLVCVGTSVNSSVVNGTSLPNEADGKAGGWVGRTGSGVYVMFILPWAGFRTLGGTWANSTEGIVKRGYPTRQWCRQYRL